MTYIRKGPNIKVDNPIATEKITPTGKRLYYTTQKKYDHVVKNFSPFQYKNYIIVEKNRTLIHSIYNDIKIFNKTKNTINIQKLSSSISRHIQNKKNKEQIQNSIIYPLDTYPLLIALTKMIHQNIKNIKYEEPAVKFNMLDNINITTFNKTIKLSLEKIIKENKNKNIIVIGDIFSGHILQYYEKKYDNILPLYLFSSV